MYPLPGFYHACAHDWIVTLWRTATLVDSYCNHLYSGEQC